MKVFKFGGASVKDAPAIRNLGNILSSYQNEKLVVVVSAMGKTTNFLEKVLNAYFNDSENVNSLVDELQTNHEITIRELFQEPECCLNNVASIFNNLRIQLQLPHSDNYDFDYDRIVSYGEIISTTIISDYLNSKHIETQWLDARRLVRTDNTYREGHVDWNTTETLVRKGLEDFFQNKAKVALTQGFIAGTAENQTTTLGREGSDFSAAILAYSLDAESVTVWKDVPGVLNADPKRFPEAEKIDSLTYYETVELAYYGASVIHPKTLKPLYLKNIPLYVKSFFNPQAEGTVINSEEYESTVPSIIVKDKQLLLSISPRDFSIIGVDSLSQILPLLSKYRIKINMMQNSALSFSVCVDNDPMRLKPCIEELQSDFVLKYNDNIELITIRHYDSESEKKVLLGREVLIRQSTRHTLQLAVINE